MAPVPLGGLLAGARAISPGPSARGAGRWGGVPTSHSTPAGASLSADLPPV